MKLGSKIKILREWKNYTQEYMAEKIGLTQSNYSRIERDETDVTFTRLQKIAEVLNINVDDLVKLGDNCIFNNNYGELKGTQSGNSFDYPTELIELYKDKANLLQEKVNLLEEKIAKLEAKQ
jgi:transcriptional regulator with XRE-family HTH domain